MPASVFSGNPHVSYMDSQQLDYNFLAQISLSKKKIHLLTILLSYIINIIHSLLFKGNYQV